MRTFSIVTRAFLFFYTSLGLSQTFSSDIVIDSITSSQIGKGIPIIDINSMNELGVSWATGYTSFAEVYYKNICDNGQLLDSMCVVDHLNVTTTDIGIRSLKFDYFNNPVICYGYRYDYFGPAEQYIKKSLNGGLNFIINPIHFQTVSSIMNIEFVKDSLCLLSHAINNSLGEIVVKRSFDSGLTFSDSSIISTSGGLMDHNISIIQCNNGDILCFWTEYEYSTHTTDVYYSRSVDQGISFSSPISLDSTYDYTSGIFASSFENQVYIVYFAAYDNGGIYIIFKKSNDFGYNYSSGIILHDYTNNSQSLHPLPEIRINPNIGVGVVWGQSFFSSDDIYFTFSSDFGGSFDTTIILPNLSRRYRTFQSMVISDSGAVYIVSLIGEYWSPSNLIILNKAKFPVLTSVNPAVFHEVSSYQLFQNFPNPFNSETTISFYVSNREYTELKIYDVNGRPIKTLVSGELKGGEHKIIWDGKNIDGISVSSGVYFYSLKTKDYSQTIKSVLLK